MKNTKSLRSRALLVSSVVVLVLVIMASVASAAWRDFSFVNYSGRTIKYLYISRSGYDSWSDDILGSYVLGHGESYECTYDNRFRYFDIKVVFSDGEEQICWGHDFRNLWRLTFYRSNGNYYVRSN